VGKYLNGYRRELVLWVCSLQLILENHRAHFRDKELVWINSIIYSIEVLCKLMLSGIDAKELRTIDNAIKGVQPTLYAHKIAEGENNRSVDIDLLYDLAEQAVECCKYDCKHDYGTCQRRELFLKLLIPPFVEKGPCQYYQGEISERKAM